MEKLDIAIRFGMDGKEDAVVSNTGWIVFYAGEPVKDLSANQGEYSTKLTDSETMVLRGVALDEHGAIESIVSVEFDMYESIKEYPQEFRDWLDEVCIVKPNWDASLADIYNPVTRPAGYQLAGGKELKDVLPELMGKDETIAFYKGSAIKYLTRYREKNGAEDLEKAVQYIEMIKQLEYSA